MAPENICAYTFHLEHIVPQSRGGADDSTNRALACFSCNSSKAAHITGHDPVSGKDAALFHPRKDKWDDHFRWDKGFLQILGLTVCGRATVERLKLNARMRVESRRLWRLTGRWP